MSKESTITEKMSLESQKKNQSPQFETNLFITQQIETN